MTLVIGFMSSEGVGIVADTRFGSNHTIAADAGPKIFTIPIILNKWQDQSAESEKLHLPNMGFAFAGNTFSGQSTHALASTCLQNLMVEVFDGGPSVEEVANLYARCGKLVVDERRQWLRSDIHCFEAVVFGRSRPSAASQAYGLEIFIGADGTADCTAEEVNFDDLLIFTLGDGNTQVNAQVEAGLRNKDRIVPWQVLQSIIDDENVASVGGHQQIAVSTPSGVELRPIFVTGDGKPKSVKILGFDLSSIGMIGEYWPVGSHAAIG